MRVIPLNHGKVAFVDDEDFESLSEHTWHVFQPKKVSYAARRIKSNGKWTTMLMHRAILKALSDQQVDHKDCDGLNNVRSNLRIATCAQNNRNARRRKDNTTGYKGVHFHCHRNRWQAQIRVDGKAKYLGLFSTPEEAYRAYCKASKTLHGDFSRIK